VIFRDLIAKRHPLTAFEIKYFPTTISDRLGHIESKERAPLNEAIEVKKLRFAVRLDYICC